MLQNRLQASINEKKWPPSLVKKVEEDKLN